jgi:hypothetical protein
MVGTAVGSRVGDGTGVAVASGVNVDAIGEGVDVGGTDVEAGPHPLNKTVSDTNVRNTD